MLIFATDDVLWFLYDLGQHVRVSGVRYLLTEQSFGKILNRTSRIQLLFSSFYLYLNAKETQPFSIQFFFHMYHMSLIFLIISCVPAH